MITRKLLLVFGFFFILNGFQGLLAQNSTYPLILNEYNVSNGPGGFTDEVGEFNDYVEIYNNHTASVSLSGFYLSNDRNNLFKWKFPSNYPALQPGNYTIVWMSGKNTNDGGDNFHTNFTIEQCKNQWIILSNGTGVVYDSVFVQATKLGDVRGRVDYDNIGIGSWRVFNTGTPRVANGAPTALGYAPKPQILLSTDTDLSPSNNSGSFIEGGAGAQIAFIKLEGLSYDSLFSCFDVFYTTNGDYPRPFYNGALVNNDATCYRYADSLTSITLANTSIVRAIAVSKPTSSLCGVTLLPSFCETNTYFIDAEHTQFQEEFGVISIALDKADTNWFSSQGIPTTTIHVEYYDAKKQMSEGYGIINRPPNEDWRTEQKGFYITKDDRLGYGCDFEGPVFNVEGLGTTPREKFPTLHLKGGSTESHSEAFGGFGDPDVSYGTAIRDILMQSIAAKNNLHVNPLHIKPVVSFVNGKYWGVYDLREVYDKYYEGYYNGQSPDSLDLNFVHAGTEAEVTYWDGTTSKFGASFVNDVYNTAMTRPMNIANDYNKVMNALDKASFIDFMILNSYAMNSDFGTTGELWGHNLALAKGGQMGKPGSKWHFYLWNMPSIFNYSTTTSNGQYFPNPAVSPCYLYSTNPNINRSQPTPNAYNGHGNLMTKLMRNTVFRAEYVARYQDLLNGPLKCDNLLKQFDYIKDLYQKEMLYHEDLASAPLPGEFTTQTALQNWDTNMAVLRKVIELRCYFMSSTGFKINNCYGLGGPSPISIDVRPTDAGKVKLNTEVLPNYIWYGDYYWSLMTLKAIPANSEFKFHHWELNGTRVENGFAESMDSIRVNFLNSADIVAVFTDKSNDIAYSGESANIPTGFTPNGDGLNDDFRPLGSGEFSTEYQMSIFNRWGQEVFRSTDPLTGWDGRYKGQEAQTGVYAYFITYKNIFNEEKMLKGNVTLTR